LLLRNVTFTPPEDAGWSRVTVPITCVVPPVTVLGFKVTLLICGGWTLSCCRVPGAFAAQTWLTGLGTTTSIKAMMKVQCFIVHLLSQW
jgi:hypothetical protein